MNIQAMKDWIDSQNYESLLRRWRFGPIGDPIFQGDMGDYYRQAMIQKKSEQLDNGVSASKRVGWD